MLIIDLPPFYVILRAMNIERMNDYLRKLAMPINLLNTMVGLVIGILHVYIPIPSTLGLALGVIMSLAGSVSIGMSYFFTTSKTAKPKPTTTNEQTETTTLKSTRSSTIFLCVAIPCMLLNTGASFFGMYTGTILLTGALAMSVSPIIMGTALTLALLFSISTLINSWLQTHHLWESLMEPVTQTITPMPTTTSHLNGLPPPGNAPPTTLHQALSRNSLFAQCRHCESEYVTTTLRRCSI